MLEEQESQTPYIPIKHKKEKDREITFFQSIKKKSNKCIGDKEKEAFKSMQH